MGWVRANPLNNFFFLFFFALIKIVTRITDTYHDGFKVLPFFQTIDIHKRCQT